MFGIALVALVLERALTVFTSSIGGVVPEAVTVWGNTMFVSL